jgi:glycerol kinase
MLFDKSMKAACRVYEKIQSFYPAEFAVEQDPMEIYEKTLITMRDVLRQAGVVPEEIAGIGLTSQRATWTFWDKNTGEPIYRFIVWNDTRGTYLRDTLLSDACFCAKYPQAVEQIRFSCNHMPSIYQYLFSTVPGLEQRVKSPDVIGGPVDTWLMYKLSGGRIHATSVSAASATSFYTSLTQDWDCEMLDYLGFRHNPLPEIKPEASLYGFLDGNLLDTDAEIPICGDIADQQAAMFSQGATRPNTAKCTIGTGFFFDVNVGGKMIPTQDLKYGINWEFGGARQYYVEGFIATAGAAFEWLKDELELVSTFEEIESRALSVPDNGGVYFIPALHRLTNAPLNDPLMDASFMGVTAASTRNHFIRAVMESVAFISAYVLLHTTEFIGRLSSIRIDGGASRIDTVCQMLSNLTGTEIVRSREADATAKGAAEMAAIHLGWMTFDDPEQFFEGEQIYLPNENKTRDIEQFKWWKKALARSKNWRDPEEIE